MRWQHSSTEGCLTDSSADGRNISCLPDHQASRTQTSTCGDLWQTGFTFHQRLQTRTIEWSNANGVCRNWTASAAGCLIAESTRAGTGYRKKCFVPPHHPSKGGRLKISTLNRKGSQLQGDLDFGWKSWFVQLTDETTERGQNICNTVGRGSRQNVPANVRTAWHKGG